MGDLLSKSTRSFSQYQPTNHTVSHPILGSFPVFQDPSSGSLILQRKINPNQIDSAKKQLLRANLLLNHPNISKFEGYDELSNNECLVFFEYFDCTLKAEIQKKSSEKTRFTEDELVHFIRNASAGLAYLEEKRMVHGQIRVENVVKVGQQYKLLNMTTFGNYKSTYHQALEEMRRTQIRLLSPQLQDALNNKIVDPVHEGYKDDVYALGVVVLDMMTLCTDSGMPVADKLKKASEVYSKPLINFVKKMLEHIMSLRFDCISCNRYIEEIYVGKGKGPFSSLTDSRISTKRSYLSANRNHELIPHLNIQRSMVQSQYLPSNRTALDISQRADSQREDEVRVNENAVSYLPSPITQKALLNMEETKKTSLSPYYYGSQNNNGMNSERSYGQKGSYIEFLAKPINNSSIVVEEEPSLKMNPLLTFESPVPAQRSTYQTDRKSSPRISRMSRRSRNPYDRNLSPFIKRDEVIMDVLLEDYYGNGGAKTTRDHRTSQMFSEDSDSIKRSPVQVNKPYTGLVKPKIKIEGAVEGDEYNVKASFDTPNRLPKRILRRRGVSMQNKRYMDEDEEEEQVRTRPSIPSIVHVDNNIDTKCLAPMEIDASPLYAGYSVIEEDAKKSVARKEDRMYYSMRFSQLNSARNSTNKLMM